MKKIILPLLIAVALVSGAVVFLKPKPVVAPSADLPPAPIAADETTTVKQSVENTTPAPSPAAHVPVSTMAAEQPPAPVPVATAVAENPAPQTNSLFAKSLDALISPNTPFDQKFVLWKQLKSAGQLEQAITELKQRSTTNPNDAATLTALGEAYLSKFPVDDPSDNPIVGMQVDQSLNRALKADPSNWEAQYVKAYAMSFWPAELNKGPEVVQRLSSLIDQQETMTPQPQFARTYAVLGDQYQKLGQSDYASATWKLGATKFPSDPVLQKKLRGQ